MQYLTRASIQNAAISEQSTILVCIYNVFIYYLSVIQNFANGREIYPGYNNLSAIGIRVRDRITCV